MKTKLLLSAMVLSLAFVGCSKDDDGDDIITLKDTQKVLHYGDTYQIEAQSRASVSYASEDEFHAKVTETGVVTAKHVGETKVRVSNGTYRADLNVIVTPKYAIYPEPNVKFGDSQSAVKKAMGGNKNTPSKQDETTLIYDNYSSAAPIIVFLFDENGNLSGYSVLVYVDKSDNLADFMTERYLPVSEKDGMFLFVDSLEADNIATAIGMKLYSLTYWQITYMAYSNNKSASSEDASMQMKTAFESAMPML